MKTIQVKYETTKDKENEMVLGLKFINYMATKGYRYYIENQGFLSTYDFKIKSINNKHIAWLEVKKKSGVFGRDEIIPSTKWEFAKRSTLPCYMMVEKMGHAKIFNITRLIKEQKGAYQEITRRADQPGGSRKVYRFSIGEGIDLY